MALDSPNRLIKHIQLERLMALARSMPNSPRIIEFEKR
jgi:hypothetical protein